MELPNSGLVIMRHSTLLDDRPLLQITLPNVFEDLYETMVFIPASHRKLLDEELAEKNSIATACLNPINTVYMCSIDERNKRINQYFYKTKAYTALNFIKPVDSAFVEQHTLSLVGSIENELLQLWIHNYISLAVYQGIMNYNMNHNQLNRLEFFPEASTEEISLVPLIVNQFDLMSRIDQFLSQQLRRHHAMCTLDSVIQNSTHLVQVMEKFFDKQRLRSSSSFVVLTIEDLYETFDHNQCLLVLSNFLAEHLTRETSNDLTPDGFLKLARLFLESQCFTFDGSIYQQTRGGDRSSRLIRMLADLCLSEWIKNLRQKIEESQQIIYRHENQLIFTWNQPIDDLNNIMGDLKNHEMKFNFNFIIDRSVRFINIELSQSYGKFNCKLQRSFLPDVVTQPYLTQVPIENYANGIRRHLLNTVKCSSQVENFLDELKLFEVMDVIHSYPKGFLDNCLENFYIEFNYGQSFNVDSRDAYVEFRKSLLR